MKALFLKIGLLELHSKWMIVSPQAESSCSHWQARSANCAVRWLALSATSASLSGDLELSGRERKISSTQLRKDVDTKSLPCPPGIHLSLAALLLCHVS